MTTATCPDLKELCGDRYKIRTEESYFAETGSSTNNNRDPWLWFRIVPWGDGLLAADFDKSRVTINRVKAAGFTCVQDGDSDDGATFTFRPDQFDDMATFIRPFKRMVLSDEEKAKRTQRILEARPK